MGVMPVFRQVVLHAKKDKVYAHIWFFLTHSPILKKPKEFDFGTCEQRKMQTFLPS